MKNPDVTIIIPAYNEEKTISRVISGAKEFSNRIIVALAQNSSDKTQKIVSSLSTEIIIDQGMGKGDAMIYAADNIQDGIIVFMDADGSHIMDDIPKLVNPIIHGKADMVIASRFLGGSEEFVGDFDKFLRVLFSQILNFIISRRFGYPISDTQNGFRAIKASCFHRLNLKSKHTEIETEMCMKCLRLGYNIIEVPY